MAYLTISWWDYLIFLVMISFSIIIGIYYGFFDKNRFATNENLYVEKQMNILPTGISLIASTISVQDLLAVPAEVYMHGTQFWVEVLSMPVMGIFVYFVFMPVYYKLKLSSPFEYLELRFAKILRRITSLYFLLGVYILIPVFIYAPALAFNQVSNIKFIYIPPIICLICLFYTTLGGVRAVIWADTVQFSITLCSLSVALVLGIVSVGGIANIWKTAQAGSRIEFFRMNPDPTIRTTFWNVFIGQSVRWIEYAVCHPAAIQRFLSVPTLRDSRRVLIIFVIGLMITKSIMCFSGLIIYAKYFDCDPLSAGYLEKADQIVPYYVLDVSRQIPGLGTLFVAGLFSVALSVLSTLMNVMSCTLYADFIAPFMSISTTQEKARNIIRIITVVIGVSSLCFVFVVEKLGSLFELTYIIIGCVGGAIFGCVVMGIIFPVANTKGVLYGSTASLVFMTWLIVKTEVYIWNGIIKYEPKQFYTNGCNETFSNKTVHVTTTQEEPFWLFKISFHYYMLMGSLTCVIVGILVSWITKERHARVVNPDLFSPLVRRFLPKTPTADDSQGYVLEMLTKSNKCETNVSENSN